MSEGNPRGQLSDAWGRLAARARNIENDQTGLHARVTPPNQLEDQVFQRAGEFVFESLGFRQSTGKRVVRTLVQNAQRQAKSEQDNRARMMRDGLLQEAQELANRSQPHLGSRAYPSLRRRLAEAASAARPSTTFHRLAATADWVEAKLNAEPERADSEIIGDLERMMREFVAKMLVSADPGWWKHRVPADVRERAEAKWQSNGSRGNYLEYTEFTDLDKIIVRKDNKKIFQAHFGDVDSLAMKWRELAIIRNHTAHSRTLASHERQKLNLYAVEISRLVSRAKG